MQGPGCSYFLFSRTQCALVQLLVPDDQDDKISSEEGVLSRPVDGGQTCTYAYAFTGRCLAPALG